MPLQHFFGTLGELVQGHVDGSCDVTAFAPYGDRDRLLRFSFTEVLPASAVGVALNVVQVTDPVSDLGERTFFGRTRTVGILDELTLPLIQVKSQGEFYDYHAKYEDDNTEYVFEFDLPSDVISSINGAARKAYESLQLSGLARIDLMLDKYQGPWVLEANSIPGLTDHSLVPKAATRIGMSLGELCEQMLEPCLKATVQR